MEGSAGNFYEQLLSEVELSEVEDEVEAGIPPSGLHARILAEPKERRTSGAARGKAHSLAAGYRKHLHEMRREKEWERAHPGLLKEWMSESRFGRRSFPWDE